jgi:hypothetical protein
MRADDADNGWSTREADGERQHAEAEGWIE